MKTSRDILLLAREQLSKNRLDIRHLRKAAKNKAATALKPAYPHLTSQLTGIENGKMKLSKLGARCILLQNEKPVGAIDFIKQKGRLKFSHVSFDRRFVKVLVNLLQFIEKKQEEKDIRLPETVEAIPFGVLVIRCSVGGVVKHLKIDAKRPYRFQKEAVIAEELDPLLKEKQGSESDFKKFKDELLAYRLEELRRLEII